MHLLRRALTLVVSGVLLASVAQFAIAQSRQFPADAGVINVLTINPNANDGVTNAHAAIQSAIAQARGWGVRGTVYLPNGTYLIDQPLDFFDAPPQSAGSGVTIQGESETGVVIRLMDNAPGYANANSPKTVIQTFDLDSTQTFVNSLFFNNIFDLTVDTGVGNPGAIGITFYGHNQSAVRHVTIRSGDGAGVCGLDIYRFTIPGPSLIKDVRIEGFDRGIRVASGGNYHLTFDRITLIDQNVAGFVNSNVVVAVHDLTSINSVPAVVNSHSGSHTSLITANLTGGGSSVHAIENTGFLFARNLTTSGYAGAIAGQGSNLPEYSSHPVLNPAGGATTSLGLPIEDTPEMPWDPPSQWVNVVAYGATPNDNSNDDAPAIQAAIDDMERLGATTLYFPRGNYVLNQTVVVRGNVRRICGMMSSVVMRVGIDEDRALPTWRLQNTNHPILFIDRMIAEQVDAWRKHGIYFDNARTDPLVIAHFFHSQGPFYKGRTDSKLFLDDVTSLRRFSVGSTLRTPLPRPKFDFGANRVWARQFNPEDDNLDITGPMVKVDGGQLVVIGMKTEGPSQSFGFYNGSKVEFFGGVFLPGEPFKDQSALPWTFIIDRSEVALTAAAHRFGPRTFYTDIVHEVQDAGTYLTRLSDANMVKRNNADEFAITLYRSATNVPAPSLVYPYLQDATTDRVTRIAAVNYDDNTPLDPWFSNRAPHEWTQINDGGVSAMQALPDSGELIVREQTSHLDPQEGHVKSTINAQVNQNARLEYQVFFYEAGTYYVWLRGNAPDADGDEVNIGINGGLTPALGESVNGFPIGAYGWTSQLKAGGRARVEVLSPGIHAVTLWMKKDGLKIADIVLTKNASYDPAVANPAYSARGVDFIGTGGGLAILTSALPAAVTGVSYTANVAAAGGTSPYTWSIASGALPGGLSLNAGTGQITGAPSTAGTYAFTLAATDADSTVATQPLTIVVAANTAPVITTTTLPAAVQGVAYNQPLAHVDGNGPFAWSLDSGTLPPGVTLGGGGALAGTPTSMGTYAFVVRITDGDGDTDTQALELVVAPPPLAIETTLVYDAAVGAAYSFDLVATGAVAPYTWTLESGSLPAGLALQSGGQITGTPTTTGSASFTLRATGQNGGTQTRAFTMNVVPAGTVPHLLARWTFNDGPADEVGGNGGTLQGGAVLVQDGSNPALVLDGVDSFLHVPGVAGLGSTPQVTVMAWVKSDTNNWNAWGMPLSFRNRFILSSQGGGRNWDFYISDGYYLHGVTATMPSSVAITQWHHYVGTYDGSTLRAYVDGVLVGQRTVDVDYVPNGNAAFTIGQDLATRFFKGRVDDVAIYSRALAQAELGNIWTLGRKGPLQMSTTTVPAGQVDARYSTTIAASGGTLPLSWSVSSGQLPAGLTLNPSTGVVSGIPVVAGNTTATITLTDADGGSIARAFDFAIATKAVPPAERTVSVNFHASPTYAVPVDSTTFGPVARPQWNNLPLTNAGGTFGGFHDQQGLPVAPELQLTVKGAGLAVREAGTATTAEAKLGRSMTSWGAETAEALVIAGLDRVFDLSEPVTLYTILGTDSGGDRTVTLTRTDTSASATMTGNAGHFDATWVAGVDHVVFTGLTTASIGLNYASGGGFPYNKVGLGGLQLVGKPLSSPTIVAGGAFEATAGGTFSTTFTASGGLTPYTWGVAHGALPPGLTLNAVTGELAGQPTTGGTYSFYIYVEDAQGRLDTEPVAVTVSQLALNTTTLTNARAGTGFAVTLQAQGGAAPYTWSIVAGSLPAGLTLNAATGEITGTATTAGAASFTLRVTEAGGVFADRAFTLTVAEPLLAPTLLTPAPVNSGYVVDTTHNGAGDMIKYNGVFVGDHTTADRQTRGILKLSLAGLTDTDPLIRGVLRLSVSSVHGTVSDVVVEHLTGVDGSTIAVGDFHATAIAVATIPAAAITAGATVRVDVRTAVDAAIAAGKTHLTLRLRPAVARVLDGADSYANFHAWNAASAVAPRLETTFDPYLLGWWSFTHGGEDDARGNDATLAGGATIQPENGNDALVLSGGAHAAVSAVTGIGDAKQFSVAVWARSNTANWNDYGLPLSYRNVFILHSGINTKSITAYLRVGGSWQTLTPSFIPAGWDLQAWHLYTLTFDGVEMKLYYDDILVGSKAVSGALTPTATSPFYFGRDMSTRFFNGALDDIQLFRRVLTAAEIAELVNGP